MDAVKEQIEAIMDKHGVVRTLEMIAEICAEKADHLRSNWQDDVSATEWDLISSAVDSAVERVRE